MLPTKLPITNYAITLSPAAQAWLEHSSPARVLHVFENACNLVNQEGEVLAIVNPDIGNGPFSIVLAEGVDFRELVDAETPVEVEIRELVMGNWGVGISNAEIWNPRPPWEKLTPENLAWALPRIETQLSKSITQPATIQYPIPITSYQLRITNPQTFAASLAGLGPGLTPAGDDFLMGVMHALWAMLPLSEAARICGEMVSAAAPVTTTLSGAWLRAAGRGEAGEAWHHVFAAMAHRDEYALKVAASRILRTGHTSGADALAGFHDAGHAFALPG